MRKTFAALTLCMAVPLLAAAAPAAGIEILPAEGSYVVNSDSVNLRASPDIAEGKVVGKLNKGATVEVIGMTALTFPVQNMRAAWFRIATPDSWIYGYFLDPVEPPSRAGRPPAYREER